jgi:putative SOS response-associated peptidase YedK
MCTNFIPTRHDSWVHAQFGVHLPPPDSYPPEAYPGYLAPVLVQGKQSGRMACGLASFGLVPRWAKDPKIARHTYNARAETVADKPSYRDAWREKQLGIVLLDAFYEPCYETGKAQRGAIGLESGDPMGIACLWERWTPPDAAQPLVSFSMLTVNADDHPVMRQFHRPEDEKRTPLVLDSEGVRRWLNASRDDATQMLLDRRMPALKRL